MRYSICGSVCALSLSLIAGSFVGVDVSAQRGQGAAPAPQLRDVYHLTAFRAAPGRLQQLIDLLKQPALSGPGAPTYSVVFRHQEGAGWDLMLIDHMGARATLEIAANPPQPPPGPPLAELAAWHQDTFAAGPPVEEFRRALNLPAAAGGAAPRGLWVVGEFEAAPGRRTQMRGVLDQIAGDTPGRTVRLAHIEGAPWTDFLIVRYDSWRQLADENDAPPKAGAPDRGLQLREHAASHQDTLASVAAIVPGPKR